MKVKEFGLYIKDPKKLFETLEDLKENYSLEERDEFFTSLVQESKKIVTENQYDLLIEKLVSPEKYEGTLEFPIEGNEFLEEFKEFQGKIKDVFDGEWNENIASVSLAYYITNGGQISGVDENTYVTNGKLFGLAEDHKDFNTLSPMTIARVKDVKEWGHELYYNPISSLGETYLSYRKNPTERVIEKLKTFGIYEMESESGDKMLEMCLLVCSTDYEFMKLMSCCSPVTLEQVEEQCGLFGLTDDQKNSMVSLSGKLAELEAMTDAELVEYTGTAFPVVISSRELLNKLLFSETSEEDSYLLPLVSLVRSKGITKEELEDSTKKYKVFSKPVLKSLLSSIPDKVQTEENIETEQKEIVQEQSEEISSPEAPLANKSSKTARISFKDLSKIKG